MASNNNAHSNNDPTYTMMVAFAVIVFLMVGCYFLLPYLKTIWVYYSRVEGYLTLLTTFNEDVKYQAEQLIDWSKTSNPQNLDYLMFARIRHTILAHGLHNYFFVLVILIAGTFSALRWRKYKGLPTIASLLKTEHKVWPTLEFIKRFDPNLKWEELRGKGRYLVTPFTYCVENGILTNYKAKKSSDRVFSEEKAQKVYSKSLGREFLCYSDMTGLEQLLLLHCLAAETGGTKIGGVKTPDHLNDVIRMSAKYMANDKRSLASVNLYWSDYLKGSLMALLDGKKPVKSSNSIVNQVMESVINQDLDIKKQRKKNPYITDVSIIEFLQSAKSKHSFNSTLLISAMRHVKRLGKFVSGRLVYFKAFDRQLFLLINMTPYYVERDAHKFISGFGAETIGVFSHYQHEVFAKRGLKEAYVGTAVTSIKARLIMQNLIRG